MKLIRHSLCLCLLLSLCSVSFVSAAEGKKKSKAAAAASGTGQLAKVGEQEAAWAEKARASYPLKVCLATDEKLGAAGENAEFIYREKGQPDRLVIFCCDGCEDDFKKEPAKFNAKLDAAAKQKRK